MNDKKTIQILWTGGFDSTYIMMKYARQDVLIHPLYVVRQERLSKEHELRAMNTILALLKNEPTTKAYFFDIEIIDENLIYPDEEILNAYKRIRSNEYPLGSQYISLARLAKFNPGLYLGLPKKAKGGMLNRLKEHGRLLSSDSVCYCDPENMDPDYYTIFGNFCFPIHDNTEEDILADIKEWKQEHIFSHIWFCHHPVNDKPCGVCVPCRMKLDAHLEFLFPEEAIKRYTEFNKIAYASSVEEAKKHKDRLRAEY